MATMNRNINLEEINTDALFGIQYLNYQSIYQKLILGFSVLASIVITMIGSIFLEINSNLLVIAILLPIGIGVLFGCNYNQDLSLFRYMILRLSNSKTVLESVPTEDFVEYYKKLVDQEKEQEKKKLSIEEQKNQQKKLLVKVIIGFAIGIIFFICLNYFLSQVKNNESIHHEVGVICVEEQV